MRRDQFGSYHRVAGNDPLPAHGTRIEAWIRFLKETPSMRDAYRRILLRPRPPSQLSDFQVQQLLATLLLSPRRDAVRKMLIELLADDIVDIVLETLKEADQWSDPNFKSELPEG